MHRNTVNSHEPHMNLTTYDKYYNHDNDGGYCIYPKNETLRNKRYTGSIRSTFRKATNKMRSLGDVDYWGDTFNKKTYMSGYQSNTDVFDKHGWRPTKNLKGSNKHTEYREEYTDMDLPNKLNDVIGNRSIRPYKKRKRPRSADSDDKQKSGYNLPTYQSRKGGKPMKLAIFSMDSSSSSSSRDDRPSYTIRKRRDREM